MTAPVVHIAGATVHRDGRLVREDIGFDVAGGAFLGSCGPNGAGTTPLLQASLEIYSPLDNVELRAGAAVANLAQSMTTAHVQVGSH